MNGCAALGLLLALLLAGESGAAVTVWEPPAGQAVDAGKREGWRKAEAGSACAGGVILENERLLVTLIPGAPGASVCTKAGATLATLLLLAADGTSGPLGELRLKDCDLTEAALEFAAGSAQATLVLRSGTAHLEVSPGTNTERLEVRAEARYAIVPSFNAEDKVYDASQHQAALVPAPAGPILLECLAGRQALLALMWKDEPSGAGAPGPEGGAPPSSRTVDLKTVGAGAARTFASASLPCAGKPLYLALLLGDGIWHDLDARKLPGAKTAQIDWKRPFEGAWRVDCLVAGYDPQTVKGFLERAAESGLSQGNEKSWRAAYRMSDEKREDTASLPLESLYFQVAGKDGQLPKFNPLVVEDERVWPFVFKGQESLVTPVAEWPCYPDPTRERLAAAREAWAKAGKEPFYPPHLYGTFLIYPVDRTEKTPVNRFTVVDVMRHALGIGPCKLDWLEKCQ